MLDSVEESVRENLEWLKHSPFVREDLVKNTYGFVYDVITGRVTGIE